MKKLAAIIVLSLSAGLYFPSSASCAEFAAATQSGARNNRDAAGAEKKKQEGATEERDADTGDDGADWKNPDSDKSADLDRNRDAEADGRPRRKDYVSIRKRQRIFEFHMGFSLGGLGYGAFGPRRAVTERYRFRYEKGSFNLGFRGGAEALFFIKKRHCLSVGLFYEQRKIQIKIVDLALMGLLFRVPLPGLYYLPFEMRIDKSNVDLNHFAFPIAYRFYIMDEFYTGLSLDLAVPFQAKASYNITFYGRSMDFKKLLWPVDFGGRLLFGFTMNRVFIEVGIGCGFIDYDRLDSERHPISLTGMMGYRI